MANHHPMLISEHTQSFKSLSAYAIPYGIGYMVLPYFLSYSGFMLGGFVLTIFIVIVLNIAVIILFRQRQHRGLEKIECSRIALISMLLTLMMSMAAFYFNIMEVPWLQLGDKGIYRLISIVGLMAFVINYAVIFYSLWLMQRFWRRS